MFISEDCIGCGYCRLVCRSGAISRGNGTVFSISRENCVNCGMCMEYCPTGAIIEEEERSYE